MGKLRSAYRSLIIIGSYLQSPLLLAMRLFWGYNFFITGMGKLQNISHVAEFFGTLKIPFPELNAYISASVECFCGLCLLIGFASRLISIPLIFIMVVAYLTAHLDSLKNIFEHPQNFINQLPFNYLLTSLIIFIFGPGRISIDYFLQRVFFKSEHTETKI